jgi:hypothetical protein
MGMMRWQFAKPLTPDYDHDSQGATFFIGGGKK